MEFIFKVTGKQLSKHGKDTVVNLTLTQVIETGGRMGKLNATNYHFAAGAAGTLHLHGLREEAAAQFPLDSLHCVDIFDHVPPEEPVEVEQEEMVINPSEVSTLANP